MAGLCALGVAAPPSDVEVAAAGAEELETFGGIRPSSSSSSAARASLASIAAAAPYISSALMPRKWMDGSLFTSA
jgi:hypothetical protein